MSATVDTEVPREETQRQMALLIALLVENGCKVYLRSEDDELRGDSVEMVTKDGEEIFHEVGVCTLQETSGLKRTRSKDSMRCSSQVLQSIS